MRPPITLRILMGVKATFGTSIAVNAKRARGLDLISQDQFVSLRKQLSARRWNPHEPVDLPREQPLLIRKVVEKLAGKGSIMQQAERLAIPCFRIVPSQGRRRPRVAMALNDFVSPGDRS